MPITIILLLVYAVASIIFAIGFVQKIRLLKISATAIFLVGIIMTAVLMFGLDNM